MHAICGYPVKSTWIKSFKTGNLAGWLLLTEKKAQKYYLESTEITKDHLNQMWKNVCSAKTKATPFNQSNANACHKKWQCFNTILQSNRKVPIQLHQGNYYSSGLFDIDSSAIFVKPIKNQNINKLVCLYNALILSLQHAGFTPQKNIIHKISPHTK